MKEIRRYYRATFRNGDTLPIEARDKEGAYIMALTIKNRKPIKVELIGEVSQ